MKEKIESILKSKFKKLGDKEKKEKEKRCNYKSRKYNIALTIIVCGYVFFFLSNSIFNSEGDIMSTSFDKAVAMNNYKVTMKSSTYSNTNNILEVNFQLEKTNLTFDKELLLEVKERKKPNEKLKAKLINLNGKDYTVVVNLPKEWTTVLLTFTEDNEIKTSTKFYVDRRESIEDSTLKEKSRREYLLQTVDKELDEVNGKIVQSEDEIIVQNKKIEQIKLEITRLEGERKYLTESELLDINSKIESLYSDKVETEKTIMQLEDKRREMNSKLEKLEVKRSDYDKMND
ncbi:hypothetical protein [Clostridium sp. LP20]|uniref:hypothetical protein n=1 Tax=Clostridium sp. LP20 TaxID=3418665 RepID=UPI003EE68342